MKILSFLCRSAAIFPYLVIWAGYVFMTSVISFCLAFDRRDWVEIGNVWKFTLVKMPSDVFRFVVYGKKRAES